MKLRKPVLILAAALLPFLVMSCFWQGPAAAGSIAFSVSSKALKSFSADAETVRVYLMSGDTLYPIQAAGYDEVSFTAGSTTAEYTSPPVPAGTYTMMIAVGKKENGALLTTDYADPVTVTVSPGVSTPVSVTLKPSPFASHGLWGQDVTGAALVGGTTLFATTTKKLYQFGLLTDPIAHTLLATVPAGYEIRSVSEGVEFGYGTVPWLNTNKGIVPYSFNSSGLVTTFASGNGAVDVLDSAGIETGPDTIALYERSAGLGGSVVASGVPGAWVDVDLSDFLSGKPFTDVIRSSLGTSYAYFASSLGAFRLPTSIVGVDHTAQEVLDAADFFKVVDGGKEIPILSLAIYDDLSGSPLLLMGTDEGVYTAVLDEASADVIGTPTLLPGTEGKRVTKIRTIGFSAQMAGYTVLAAFLSDTDVSLYDGTDVTSFPFYSGLPQDLPGDINTISFAISGSHIDLVIVGKKGMVSYDTLWIEMLG